MARPNHKRTFSSSVAKLWEVAYRCQRSRRLQSLEFKGTSNLPQCAQYDWWNGFRELSQRKVPDSWSNHRTSIISEASRNLTGASPPCPRILLPNDNGLRFLLPESQPTCPHIFRVSAAESSKLRVASQTSGRTPGNLFRSCGDELTISLVVPVQSGRSRASRRSTKPNTYFVCLPSTTVHHRLSFRRTSNTIPSVDNLAQQGFVEEMEAPTFCRGNVF